MLTGLVMVLGAVVAPTAPGGADAIVGSSPAAGEVVVSAPTTIELEFDESPGVVEVRVLDSSGRELDAASVDGESEVVTVGGLDGAVIDDGDLVVAWEATALGAQGAFLYTVDPTGEGTVLVARDAEAATDSLRITRVLVALAAAVGLLAAAGAVARGSSSSSALLVAVGVGAATSLVGLALAGVPADGGPLDALSPSSWVDGLRDGRLWLIPLAALGGIVLASTLTAGRQVVTGSAVLIGVVGAGWLMVSSAELGGDGPYFSERLSAEAGSVELTVEPAQPGVNEVHLYGFSPEGSLLVLSEATMWAVNVDRDVGPLSVPVIRAGSNHFLTYSAVLPFGGLWELTVQGVTSDGDEMSMSTEVEL